MDGFCIRMGGLIRSRGEGYGPAELSLLSPIEVNNRNETIKANKVDAA